MIANLGLGGTTFGSGCLLDDLIHLCIRDVMTDFC